MCSSVCSRTISRKYGVKRGWHTSTLGPQTNACGRYAFLLVIFSLLIKTTVFSRQFRYSKCSKFLETFFSKVEDKAKVRLAQSMTIAHAHAHIQLVTNRMKTSIHTRFVSHITFIDQLFVNIHSYASTYTYMCICHAYDPPSSSAGRQSRSNPDHGAVRKVLPLLR